MALISHCLIATDITRLKLIELRLLLVIFYALSIAALAMFPNLIIVKSIQVIFVFKLLKICLDLLFWLNTLRLMASKWKNTLLVKTLSTMSEIDFFV